MLVLASNRNDLTTDWLVLELERRQQPFVRLCTEDYPTKTGITWTLDGATLDLAGDFLPAADISAVWWRRPLPAMVPADRRGEQAAWAAGEARVAWQGYWNSVDAHWVNNPGANARADNKPSQLRAARRVGLRVPPTLITNSLAEARAFLETHVNVVSKPLYDGVIPSPGGPRVIYTQRLRAQQLNELEELGPEPYLFQALVDKTADVRVTVIGDRVFGCRIDSQVVLEAAVDWRRAQAEQLRHEPISLDPATTRQVQELTSLFGLRFAAIDLALDSDDGFVFFEINPNGQWAWVEQLTRQPLSAALADELLQHG